MAAHMSEDPEMTVDERAGLWCARLAEGDLTPGEQAEFEAWLDAAPEHQRRFDKALALWNRMEAIAAAPEIVTHRQKALASYRSAQRARWQVRGRPAWLWAGGAAAATLIAGLVWAGQQPVRYETGPGDRRIATLADGSRVALDADSRIAVAFHGHRRDIELLRGRASFTVAHDRSKPFSVRTGPEVVVATGTAFSVEKLSQQVRVILYEGHVRVLQTTYGQTRPQMVLTPDGRTVPAEALLTPGRQLVLSTGGDATIVPVGQVDTAPETSSRDWEDGQLDFDNEALAVAAERVNRYARGVRLTVTPDAAAVRISGTFNAGDTEAFAAGVSMAFPVRPVRMGNQIALVKK